MTPLAAIVRSSAGVKTRQDAGTYVADQDQLAEIERYAAQRGLKFDLLPPEFDVSGGLPIEQRPSLLAAIEGVEAGRYSGIVVANLKRLTRSRSGIAIWDRVEAAGGRIYTASENIDTSDPNGRFIRDIHLAEAVREREEHVDRFDNRRRAATEAGIWQRRQHPKGYVRDATTRRLVVDESGAREIVAAFEAKAAGEPVVSIARRIGMTPSGVRQLLKNRVYLGELHVGRYSNLKAHPPIIDADLFRRAQPNGVRPPRSDKPVALLAALVRCQACGHKMTRGLSGGYSYYGCPRYHSGGECPAPSAVMCTVLDTFVEPIAVAELARLRTTVAEGNGAESARQRLADAEAETAAYLVVARATDPGFAEGLQQRRGVEDAARDAVSASLAASPALALPTDLYGELTPAERNQAMRAVLGAVVVARAASRSARPESRVTVVKRGAPFELPVKRGGTPLGIVPLVVGDLHDEHVLRPLARVEAA